MSRSVRWRSSLAVDGTLVLASSLLLVFALVRSCSVAYADPLPPTRSAPVGSACHMVDDPETPEAEAGLVVVTAPSALTALVRLDRCNAEFEVSRACHGKLVACQGQLETATADPPPSRVWTGLKWGGIAAAVVVSFIAGWELGNR